MNKKVTLIFIYFSIWSFIVLEQLYIGVFQNYKSRAVMGLYIILLLLQLPNIMFRILTEFNIGENKKLYSSIICGFTFAIMFGFWSGKIDDKRIEKDGEETVGVVYDAWRSRVEHLVRINYTVGHKKFTTFSDTDFTKNLSIGDTVIVIYWKNNPDLYKIKELRKQ